MIEKENSCTDCKFFTPYYVKDKTKFIKTLNGVCRNDALRTCDKRKHVYRLSACENFEKKEAENIDKESIGKVLRNMAQNLEDIASFIKNGE